MAAGFIKPTSYRLCNHKMQVDVSCTTKRNALTTHETVGDIMLHPLSRTSESFEFAVYNFKDVTAVMTPQVAIETLIASGKLHRGRRGPTVADVRVVNKWGTFSWIHAQKPPRMPEDGIFDLEVVPGFCPTPRGKGASLPYNTATYTRETGELQLCLTAPPTKTLVEMAEEAVEWLYSEPCP